MYYISTETIIKAYNKLSRENIRGANILFTFFLLSSVGANKLTYINLENIKNVYEFAHKLSGLFSPEERTPPSHDFINPLNMKTFGSNPTEPLKKWIGGRVKNNIIGGATTWRNIIMQEENTETFKFRYDYLDEILKLTIESGKKIDIAEIAIWFNRFTRFEHKVTVSNLINDFIKVTKLSKEAVFSFFNYNSADYLTYDATPHNSSTIRSLIGNPTSDIDWLETTPNLNQRNIEQRRFFMSNSATTKEGLQKTLLAHKQLVLVGPPGTSKSYVVSQITSHFSKVIHVQFHPQYTYQQFVGGYRVEKSDVVYRKGIILNLIDEAIMNPANKYLLIIDEINRANTSQVFGEIIQALDRGTSVDILVENTPTSYIIPDNIYIVGTMNSTDRTIGTLDYALKRRFLTIYFPSTPELLVDLCPNINFISCSELLKKMNITLNSVLPNKEFVIGHAVFLDDTVKKGNQFVWSFETFEPIFNYKILPIIEDYCNGNYNQIVSVLGTELPKRLSGEEFKEALKTYTE